jgi:DNA-binding response OmpR family regulator
LFYWRVRSFSDGVRSSWCSANSIRTAATLERPFHLDKAESITAMNNVEILVAADQSADLYKLTSSLATAEFKVISATDQESIVRLARCEAPSLILLDLKSCFEICRILKGHFLTESIPIIVLLSPTYRVDPIVAFEFGADDCIVKPTNFRELALRIRCSLARACQGAPT